MAKSNFNDMKKVLTSKQITIKLKMRIVKCYIYSTLMYGSETWILNKQMEDRINAFEMWIYRRIGRTSWKERKTNTEVMAKLKVKKRTTNGYKNQTNKIFWSHQKT